MQSLKRLIKTGKLKKIYGVLDTKDKVAKARIELELATEDAFREFGKPVRIPDVILD